MFVGVSAGCLGLAQAQGFRGLRAERSVWFFVCLGTKCTRGRTEDLDTSTGSRIGAKGFRKYVLVLLYEYSSTPYAAKHFVYLE